MTASGNPVPEPRPDNEALRRFLRRVWEHDVRPLLEGERANERRRTARVAGKLAAGAGLLMDGLFRLRGRPFTRCFTVVGSSLGAMLPDVWDWDWLRNSADPRQREAVEAVVARRAAELPPQDALDLFGLPAGTTRQELKTAWRRILQRWHPDKAPSPAARIEYHATFLVYKGAYERLCAAIDDSTGAGNPDRGSP